MPYSIESGQNGRREQEKAWKRRNSDGKTTLDGEVTHAPPAFIMTESALPISDASRPADREDPEGVAERHTHVYGVPQPDWVVEP